jgi:hypothetical protein
MHSWVCFIRPPRDMLNTQPPMPPSGIHQDPSPPPPASTPTHPRCHSHPPTHPPTQDHRITVVRNLGGPAVRDLHLVNFSVGNGGQELIVDATVTLAWGRRWGGG